MYPKIQGNRFISDYYKKVKHYKRNVINQKWIISNVVYYKSRQNRDRGHFTCGSVPCGVLEKESFIGF